MLSCISLFPFPLSFSYHNSKYFPFISHSAPGCFLRVPSLAVTWGSWWAWWLWWPSWWRWRRAIHWWCAARSTNCARPGTSTCSSLSCVVAPSLACVSAAITPIQVRQEFWDFCLFSFLLSNYLEVDNRICLYNHPSICIYPEADKVFISQSTFPSHPRMLVKLSCGLCTARASAHSDVFHHKLLSLILCLFTIEVWNCVTRKAVEWKFSLVLKHCSRQMVVISNLWISWKWHWLWFSLRQNWNKISTKGLANIYL